MKEIDSLVEEELSVDISKRGLITVNNKFSPNSEK